MRDEKYYLSDLILFFKAQQGCDFETIKVILEVISDPDISFEAKNGIILDFLRLDGLFEVGATEEECKKEYLLEQCESEPGKHSVIVPMEEYTISILNGTIIFNIPVN